MSEELQSKYSKKGKIIGQILGEYQYFQIGSTTFNQLSESKIISKRYDGKFNSHKPDRLIVDRGNPKPLVIAVIEDKKIGKFNSENEKLKAIRQCNNYCQELNAKMGIITDNSTTVWINPTQNNKDTEYEDEVTGKRRSYTLIKREDGAEVIRSFKIEDKKDLLNPDNMDDDIRKLYKLIKEISLKINNKNSIIKEPERIDPLPLARRVWQDIWVATGKSPEKCLYNVVELFIFKFLSDLEILTDPNDFDSLYRLVEKGNKPEEILRYYVNNCRKKIYNKDNEDDCLFPAGKDGTTVINGTIFVDENGNANITQALLFKESIKKFKDFDKEFGKFSTHNIDKDFKTKLYETFLKQTASLKALGQFFTPRKVIRSIVEMSEISKFSGGERVCDPFCGVGGFILESLNIPERINDFKPKNKKIKSPICYMGYDKGFEKDEERTIILAKANMLIYLSEIIAESQLTREFAQNAFNKTFHLWRSNLGTLQEITTNEEDKFNLILTNPPYVKRGIKTLKNEITQDTDLRNFYKINGGGLEGLALEWIIRHLKKGGKAFVVIPYGILNRVDDKKLRKFILQECYLDGIVSLPQKTFYATPIKTYILAITKKEDVEKEQDFPVYTYLVSNIGETLDINRFETPEKNELPEMVDLFGEYLIYRSKDKVKELNKKSSRCKIQPIEKFDSEKYWSVDRWWTKEEKIELGIEEEENEITPDEFFDLLEDSYKELGTILKEGKSILKKKITPSSEHKFKTISLDDKYFFNLNIGKRLLKRDLFGSKDNPKTLIPVYSANVFTPFGYVDKSNIEEFDNPFVLWGIDGNFDLTSKPKGELFASTDHCGTIEILNNKISPEYLLLALNLKKYEYGFDRSLRSNLGNVSRVEIEIPIDNKGDLDLDYQEKIVLKNSEILNFQERIKRLKEQITEVELNFSEEFEYEEKELSELFHIKQGNAYYTKKRVLGNNWRGVTPVYSSNTKEEGLLMTMDLSKIKTKDLYYQNCLTWAVDGYAGGKIFVRNENNNKNENKKEFNFTINNHSGILIPKSDALFLPFIKEMIQPIFYKKSKGYGNNKVGTNQIKNILVKVPVNKKGEYNLEKQKEIAKKYPEIEEIRKELTDKLDTLAKVKISIE